MDNFHKETGDLVDNLMNIFIASRHEEEIENKNQEEFYTEFSNFIICAANLKLIYNVLRRVIFFTCFAVFFNLYTTKKLELSQITTFMLLIMYYNTKF